MEAVYRVGRRAAAAGFLVWIVWGLASGPVTAASFRTQNFIIDAPSQRLARKVAEAAEKYRRELAEYWLGTTLKAWPSPCPVRVISGPNLAAQGMTQYDRAPVRNFVMEVIGSEQRILDSVLPHEVSHTVLATHFGRPLPRWADEGICTTVEHASERAKHEAKLREFLRSRRGIAMNKLFLMTEYPSDVLPMYAQGYSVCRFLIQQGGPRSFIEFLTDYMRHPSWTENVRKHYGYESLAELQSKWLAWVADGSGPVDRYVKAGAPADVEPSGVRPASLTKPADAPKTRTLAASDSFYARQTKNRDRPHSPKTSKGDRPSPEGDTHTPSNGTGPRSVRPPPAPAAASPAATAQIAAGDRGDASNPTATASWSMVPPSVRNSGRYSVAQPQPEQGVSGRSPAHRPPRWAGTDGRWR